ncbi:MAG: sulfatase [Bryobacteraceae bacterium]|nr:sulfatase [Bryobacteraceae bacterium]
MRERGMTRRAVLQRAAAMAAGGLVQAQTARRPNILFVIADDWSNRHASVFGTPWVKTPAFDRVAREGVLFTNCFTSNPKCSPSRATMLTGRNTWQLKEAVNHQSIFPNEFPVYPSILEKSGYFTGFTGKGWGPGDFRSTGFAHNPAGREFVKFTAKPAYAGISNKDYARNFEYFLQQRPSGQPFCFWLGFHEPHRFYEEGSGVRAGKNPAEVKLPGYYPNSAVIRNDLLDYALEVESNDQHLGRVMEALEKAGELENTLLVVTSDHGMPFPRSKGQIYEEGFHIPLAVRWGRNIAGGRVVDDFINARDFAPTFLEAAGVKPPETMTGRGFLDVLRSTRTGFVDPARNVMLIGKERHDIGRPNDWGYPVRAIRTPEYLYVRNYEPDRWPVGNPETGYRNCDDSPTKRFILNRFDEQYRLSFGKRPPEELYDMKTDPDCLRNLADEGKHVLAKRALRERMEAMLKEEGDPRLNGNAAFFDTIRYTGGSQAGYDQWLEFQRAK